MKSELIKDKIKVFISSSCDGPLRIVRKALADLLEETNMCSTFVFENEAGSTCDVVSSYMWPLDEYHVVIVLIDSAGGIGAGTLKEINRAKTQNKKIAYVFCTENVGKDLSEEGKTKEKQVESFISDIYSNLANPKTVKVNSFAEMPYAAYKTAMQDITNMYIYYCRGRITSKEEVDNDAESQLLNTKDTTTINKDILKNHSSEKEYLCNLVGIPIFPKRSMDNESDLSCYFLGAVIGEKELLNEDSWNKFKESIIAKHTGAIRKVISGRFQAIELVSKGKIQESIEVLSQTLEKEGKVGTVPEWVKGDILIDLRNLTNLVNNESKDLTYKNEWQDVLTERENPIYYPVLDRCQNSVNEAIIDLYARDYRQSPYTVNLGGADSAIDQILDAFSIASHFGSITQLAYVRKRLYQYLVALCFRYREHSMFIVSIEQMLLSGEFKELQQFYSAYGETTENIVSDDVDRICKCVHRIPFRIRKVMAEIYVTRLFGYYFSDDAFSVWWQELKAEVKVLLEDSFALHIWVNPFLESIDGIQYRIGIDDIYDLIQVFYNKKCGAWIDSIFKIINTVDLSRGTKEQKVWLVSFLESCLSDEWTRQNAHALTKAVLVVRNQVGKEGFEVIDRQLKKYFESFYNDVYLLELSIHDKDTEWKYVKRFIRDIDERNTNQGKDGMYSGYSINPYVSISNIIRLEGYSLDSNKLKVVLDSIRGTLDSETQTIDAKCEAISLLITIQMNQPRNKQIESLVEYIKDNWVIVSKATNALFIKGYSYDFLCLEFACLQSITIGLGDSIVVNTLARIGNSETSVMISAAKFCAELLQYGKKEIFSGTMLNYIVQFIVSLSYDRNTTVRFYAMIGLVKLYETDYKELAIGRLTGMMDNEVYQNKVGLLSRMKKHRGTEDVEYLFRKGQADNHFWVRTIALQD